MKGSKLTDNKDIKRYRIKKYFLDAAKEMIIHDGYEQVSVRKVADVAGYSYPTLYKYYEDLNALLWDVKQDMIQDLVHYMNDKMPQEISDLDSLKKLFHLYISYYFEKPNVFKFFYFSQVVNPNVADIESETEVNFHAMWGRTFQCFVGQGKIREDEVEVLAKTLIYTIHGILTLYLSNNGELTEQVVFQDVEKVIDYLLR